MEEQLRERVLDHIVRRPWSTQEAISSALQTRTNQISQAIAGRTRKGERNLGLSRLLDTRQRGEITEYALRRGHGFVASIDIAMSHWRMAIDDLRPMLVDKRIKRVEPAQAASGRSPAAVPLLIEPEPDAKLDSVGKTLTSATARLLDALHSLAILPDRLAAVVISIPFPMRANGTPNTSDREWRHVNIGDVFARAWEAWPTDNPEAGGAFVAALQPPNLIIETNARLGAIAEHWHLSRQPKFKDAPFDLLYAKWSTTTTGALTVGSGDLRNDKYLHLPEGAAPAEGKSGDDLCHECGRRCAAYESALRHVFKKVQNNGEILAGNNTESRAASLMELVRDSDDARAQAARQHLEAAGQALGRAIGEALHILASPKVAVVVGGAFVKDPDEAVGFVMTGIEEILGQEHPGLSGGAFIGQASVIGGLVHGAHAAAVPFLMDDVNKLRRPRGGARRRSRPPDPTPTEPPPSMEPQGEPPAEPKE